MSETFHIDEPAGSGAVRKRVHLHQLELLFRQLDSLPARPAAVARVLSLTGADRADGDELARAAGTDASVAARLVSLAVRERPERTVHSIREAIDVLGVEGVRSAVLGMKVFQTAEPAGDALDPEQFSRHCLAVATIAEAAAKRQDGEVAPPVAFLSGLLHDIGKPAIAYCLPKSFRRIQESARRRQLPACRAERELLGIDHTDVGRRLAQRWRLPARLQQVIWLHHQPLETLPATLSGARLVGLVQLADAIAVERGFGFDGAGLLSGSVELARQVGLAGEDLADLAAGVPARLEELGGAASPVARAQAAYPVVLAETGAELAGRNKALAARAAELEGTLKALDRVRDLIRRVKPSMPLHQTCLEIARAFSRAARACQPARLPVCAFAVCDQGRQVALAVGEPSGREVFRFGACRATAPPPPGRSFPARELLREDLLGAEAFSDVLDLNLYTCLPLWAEGRWVGGVLLPGAPPAAEADAEHVGPLLELASFVLAGAVERARADELAESLAAASRQLAETREALAEADALAAVGEMAAGAAHEINNPLAVIAGRAQLLAERVRAKKDREAANLIAQKAQEISDIITDLLAFARPNAPAPEAVSVQNLLSAARKKLGGEQVQKTGQATVDIQVADDCPAAWVDPAQIEEVLVELVRNAATATGGAVAVRFEARGQGRSGRVLIRVIDNGPGMDPATLAAAFTPFYSARPAGRGRGMGLARAKRTVQANGGRIWIESRLNQGTTVLLELPRSPAEPTPC